MEPIVSITRQVIYIDGLALGSSPITKARGAPTIMPQSLNAERTNTTGC